MNKLKLGLLIVALFLTSCATIPRDDRIKQCSDTPHSAVVGWFHGIAERSMDILRALIPDGASVFGVFDEKRGQEIVRQILANPISGESGGCACTLLSIIDDASDPRVKIVTVKRVLIDDDDDQRSYKRAFRVRFDYHGNCILSIISIDSKWERIQEPTL